MSPENSFLQIDLTQASDLGKALTSISDQAHITFVAEGQFSSNQSYGEEASKIAGVKMPLSMLIPKLAACYDYQVEQKNNIYILYRRYTTTEQLPFVSLKEMALCLQNIDDIVSKFSTYQSESRRTGKSPVRQLIQTLNTTQLALLQDGTLPYQTLDVSPKNLATHLIMDVYLNYKIAQIKPSLGLLNSIDSKTFYVSQVPVLDKLTLPMFGYEDERPTAASKGFTPLSQFTYNNASLDDNSLQQTETISSLVGQYNASLHTHAYVEPYAANSPLTIIGKNNSTPVEVLQAATKIYGLAVSIDSKGDFHIFRKNIETPNQLSAITNAIYQAIPGPLCRAMHLEDYNNSVNAEAAGAALSIADYKIQSELSKYPSRLKQEAMTRFFSLIGKRLAETPTAKLPGTSLTEDEKSAFAIYLFAVCAVNLQTLTNSQPPAYIAHIDKILLKETTGVSEEGRKYSSISLLVPHANSNTFDDLAGFTEFESP